MLTSIVRIALSAAILAYATGAQATGPRGPVGPQSLPACVGVAVAPGTSIQSAVNANPVNTKFCLSAGTYANQSVTPKSGNVFEGVPGTILDGKNTTLHAFSGNQPSVALRNMVVKGYTSSNRQDAAIDFRDALGWSLMYMDVSYNAHVGVLMKSNVSITYSYIHHNGSMGFGTDGSWTDPGRNIVFTDNRVSLNNYLDQGDCDECGGTKMWASNGAYVAWNEFAANHGPGVWLDFNNVGYVIEQNFVHNNLGPGIEIEISYQGAINNNAIWNNGVQSPGAWGNCVWFCPQILIAASGGVGAATIDVHHNNIITPSQFGDAINLIQQNRTNSDAPTPWLVRNVKVHNNGINVSKGGRVMGLTDFSGGNAMFQPSAGNLFSANIYTLGTNTSPFSWANGQGGKAFWQGKGMDLTGTFK